MVMCPDCETVELKVIEKLDGYDNLKCFNCLRVFKQFTDNELFYKQNFQFNMYFSLFEMACHMCLKDRIIYIKKDDVFFDMLTASRIKIGKPFNITSGCRCRKHNRMCGGGENTPHLIGGAIDFRIGGLDLRSSWKLLELEGFPGMGCYPDPGEGFIHIDNRIGIFSRWIRKNGIYINLFS